MRGQRVLCALSVGRATTDGLRAMPRKPSSIYLIVEHPSSTLTPSVGLPATNLQAWRLPLEDGEEPGDAAKRGYEQHPIGSTVVWVEDTKVEAKRVGLTLEDIDDIRLGQEEEPPTP